MTDTTATGLPPAELARKAEAGGVDAALVLAQDLPAGIKGIRHRDQPMI